MPKMKTKKSVRKRFKVTKKGKVLKPKGFRRHLLTDRSSKRKRQLRRASVVRPVIGKKLKGLLPYG